MPGDSKSEELGHILEKIEEGKIVIPEFQRDFVWKPEQVRELLVSVIAGYYIGTLIFIKEMSANASPFKVKTIKGVKNSISDMVEIVLDGQQRLTSLYYAKNKPDYPLKGRKNSHIFFVDLEKIRDKEWDNAVIAVSIADKKRLKVVREKPTVIEFSDLFKLPSELHKLVRERTGSEEHADLALNLADRVKGYKLNIYYIDRDEPIETIVETFERINRTGTPLTVFDLLVARLFNYNIKLRDLLDEVKKYHKFAEVISGDYIIKTIVLMRGKAPTRKNMLEINPDDFETDWRRACESLELAYRRLLDKRTGYGVLDFENWIPYETMIIPLAAMIRYLKDKRLDSEKNYLKLDAWYWASVFGNRYEHSTDSISKQDYDKMMKWFNDDSAVPDFIEKFMPEDVDYDVPTQRSAIFRGVVSLIVLKGAKDFISGQSPEYEREKIQLDHIFPKSKFYPLYSKEYIDSILNRTIISSNQRKMGKKPSEFFGSLIKEYGKDKIIEILETHLIPEDALDSLLNDNLEDFKEKRKRAIIEEIKKRVFSY